MTVVDDRPAVAPVSSVSHPTPCPPWCADRHAPLAHHFGPTQTVHSSRTVSAENPRSVSRDLRTFISAELMRFDDNAAMGDVRLWMSGGTDGEFDRDETDMLINDLQAFVDNLRVLRRQMG